MGGGWSLAPSRRQGQGSSFVVFVLDPKVKGGASDCVSVTSVTVTLGSFRRDWVQTGLLGYNPVSSSLECVTANMSEFFF